MLLKPKDPQHKKWMLLIGIYSGLITCTHSFPVYTSCIMHYGIVMSFPLSNVSNSRPTSKTVVERPFPQSASIVVCCY